jgi:probable rRNA maturation factor
MVELVFENMEDPGLNPDFFFHVADMVAAEEGKTLGPITLVFGDNEWLLNYNKQFLQHDYYTDIITFDYCTNDLVSGDLLISLEMVGVNAKELNVPRETELNRVVIHGVLHLCGYGDKTPGEGKTMRAKEDYYLAKL